MLELINITKVFNKDQNPDDIKVALDDVNLKINNGEFVTIIGGNGSGKSTLFKIITGSYDPDNGKVLIDDINVTNLREHKRAKYIGIVNQDPIVGTAANMSLLENLSLSYRRTKHKTLKWGFNSELTEMYKERLKELDLGLENRLNQKIGLFSGGQRQAVTLLMATMERPKLLLLDEHTAALDPKTANTVLELTNSIVSDNKLTAIMITHNMKDALKYGNRLLMLANGKIILDVSGEEKKKLTVIDLLNKFQETNEIISDEMFLS